MAKWISDKPHEGVRLKCECGNQTFIVCTQKVARKVKTKSAHRKRIVAICSVCDTVKRISLGGPN